MTVVGQVEIDDYCRRVLAKHWPDVPRHDDVRTAADWWLSRKAQCGNCQGFGINSSDYAVIDACRACGGQRRWLDRPQVDVICGGFPCQDISGAGRRAGIIDGTKSSLWTYLAHCVRELRPRYVLVENVSALLVRGIDVVAGDLAALGYDLRWDCIPAAAVGAPHRRDRWFGIAYPSCIGQRTDVEHVSAGQPDPDRRSAYMANARGERRHRRSSVEGAWRSQTVGIEALDHAGNSSASRLAYSDSIGRYGRARLERPSGWGQPAHSGEWLTEPDVGRVAHGVPARVDRLRALGNAVVPQVAEHVGRLIVEHARAVAV